MLILLHTSQASAIGISVHGLVESPETQHMLQKTTLDIDKTRMAQVVTNLLSNALKFTPPGGTINVMAERLPAWTSQGDSDRAGGALKCMLRLKVVDSGAGIAAHNIPKLFKEVIQFDPGRLQNGGGSGFGLFSE